MSTTRNLLFLEVGGKGPTISIPNKANGQGEITILNSEAGI